MPTASSSSTPSTAAPSRVDADDGPAEWITQLGDINKGETMTMAPLVVKGKVLVGNSGGEFGVRGWLTALDAATGKIAWRAYSTGPDKDVLIGPNFKPFYDERPRQGPRHHDLARRRLAHRRRHRVGLDLLRPRTGSDLSTARQPRARGIPSSGRATTSGRPAMFARVPDTGEARLVLPDQPARSLRPRRRQRARACRPARSAGSTRKVAMRADRNGLLYVIDRATGEVLSAAPFGYVNSNRGVDLKTGRLIPVEEKTPQQGVVVRDICPAAPGMKDWQPIVLLAAHRTCSTSRTRTSVQGRRGDGSRATSPARRTSAPASIYKAGPGGHRGVVHGVGSGRSQGGVGDQGDVSRSGAARVVTAGDVVFYGTMDGWFKAVTRRPASCCGSSSAAPGSSASRSSTGGRTGTSTSRCCRASAAGPARSSAPISIRATPPPRNGFGGALADLKSGHDARRHALRLLRSEAAGDAACSRSLAAGRGARVCGGACSSRRAPARRRCASAPIPNNLPFSNRARRGIREPDRRAARAPIAARAWSTPGGRSGAGSSATR